MLFQLASWRLAVVRVYSSLGLAVSCSLLRSPGRGGLRAGFKAGRSWL